jgi:hypothetical protein
LLLSFVDLKNGTLYIDIEAKLQPGNIPRQFWFCDDG